MKLNINRKNLRTSITIDDNLIDTWARTKYYLNNRDEMLVELKKSIEDSPEPKGVQTWQNSVESQLLSEIREYINELEIKIERSEFNK